MAAVGKKKREFHQHFLLDLAALNSYLSGVPPCPALCLLDYAAQDVVWDWGPEHPGDKPVFIWAAYCTAG